MTKNQDGLSLFEYGKDTLWPVQVMELSFMHIF
jgi:hypothetical protein